jgi:hypothetical protein
VTSREVVTLVLGTIIGAIVWRATDAAIDRFLASR